jgi:hypothetical protein
MLNSKGGDGLIVYGIEDGSLLVTGVKKKDGLSLARDQEKSANALEDELKDCGPV